MSKMYPCRIRQEGCSPASGFTLLEIMITMAIVLILSAAAIPTMTAIRIAKLREAGSDYAGLLQNARITAIQNDTYYPVVTVSGTPTESFIDLNSDGKLESGEPVITLPSSVLVRTYADNPPALGNLESQTLASASDPSLDTADNPTFGPRGLPCKPTPSGGYTTCPAFSGTVSGTSFITFFQSEPDGTWLAVVTNPSARVRIFKYGGSTWAPVQ
ncbi:MAG TPA: type II secretion system protein [Candidatus Sulfotelmatobacter sp.]|nr:type II secretion system protein [Candidatus Sulfotelmatobacter sp.]